MTQQTLPTFADPNLVPSLLDEIPTKKFSIITLDSGWPEDLERLASSLAKHCADIDYELLAVANDSAEVAQMIARLASHDPRVRGVAFSQNVGFAGGRNAGILQSRGEVLVIADTSITATGDFLTSIHDALRDSSVGLAGKWGLVSPDLRHFHESTDGDCDAMQAYCMGFRRNDTNGVGLFDPKYKFYRNADIDWSMHWRDKGFRILALDLSIERGVHREWESLSPDQRDRKSKDNFARFLRTWRDRTDLLIGHNDPHSH